MDRAEEKEGEIDISSLDGDSATTREILEQKTKQELIELILIQKEERIPVSIFRNKIGPLGALVKFLKENKNLTIKQISERLGRNSKTIWTTYSRVKKTALNIAPCSYFVPITVFSKKKLSILESLVYYLKNTENLSFSQIAKLLERDNRTIWTCHHRAVLKMGKANKKEPETGAEKSNE